MTISTIKAVFPCEVSRVWKKVTSVSDYGWRSDLSRVEVTDAEHFIEYTSDGYPTAFAVRVCEPCRRWEFDMDNTNMRGRWSGTFRETDGGTEIVFTEEVCAKKFYMRPFAKGYLKKQQAQYVADLEKALRE